MIRRIWDEIALDLFSNFKRVFKSRISQILNPRLMNGASFKWAKPGKQEWRWGMNQTQGLRCQNVCSEDPIKSVDSLRQQDGGHGSRHPLRSV